jgi:hypothetical protein
MASLITKQQMSSFKEVCRDEDLFVPHKITPLFVQGIGLTPNEMAVKLKKRECVEFTFNVHEHKIYKDLLLDMLEAKSNEAKSLGGKLPCLDSHSEAWLNTMINFYSRGIWEKVYCEFER